VESGATVDGQLRPKSYRLEGGERVELPAPPAAGVAPPPDYPSDGIDLLPALAGGTPIERKLFWRYKTNRQRAARIGNYKFLKILDNTFLFNVVDDPLERANLKDRRRDIYDRLVAEWEAWNAAMLPEVPESFTESYTGAQIADRYGLLP